MKAITYENQVKELSIKGKKVLIDNKEFGTITKKEPGKLTGININGNQFEIIIKSK